MKQPVLFLIVFFCSCTSSVLAEDALPVFTNGEVAKHASRKDCWLIIDNAVYDVTTYIPRHPAPPESIIDYCGKESSKAFHTKNKGSPHSARATRLLSTYLVGIIIPDNKEIVAAPSGEPTPELE